MQLARIYKITNKKNNNIYIGQTTRSVQERYKGHLHDSKTSNLPLYKDIREFGTDAFVVEEITICLYINRLELENYYINYYFDKGYALYNLVGLKSPNSRRQKALELRMNNGFDYTSEEFKYKMSKVTSGENNGMFGLKGSKAPNGQTVYALDEKQNIIHTFVSVREALKFLNIKGHSNLNKACKENTLYKGYYWKKEWKKYA
ncbi:GIY-YIG nuclease family protein [Mammaliicoccus sciuri]|uniref:GIY-YIG nuclease family protein n=1 Tax=Mammaliicoccus sciuri TaxID=1296 RepID=UPI002B263899|nr:GIY-YIG nuclease family protein [Mammaliicoccus sciuri]WQL34336.1 GIY-YIG nuclease family protein [Mammaliicoccus sciuri]WQL61275.1 GIY-YIG nuclease family protein [Mammaliicoccus sciuri]